MLIRLCRCAGWSESLLLTDSEDRISYVVALVKACEETNSNILATTQSQINALEQRINDKLTDLENKLNHVEEFVILKNNKVKKQLVNI